MKIAFVSSEAVPYSKTGGLADVSGSLPKALEKAGFEVKLFIPKYFNVDEAKYGLKYRWDIGEIPIRVAGHVRSVHLHQAMLPDSNVEVNFIDCPYYFFRGQIYTNDWDEDERFILFCKAVIEALQRIDWSPDVIHCNDWQCGLLPLFLKDNYAWDKKLKTAATLFTIHNIGYQGRFGSNTSFKAEISGEHFYPGGPVEYHGDISFMKAGIMFSDLISTVSETYAKEILTPEYGAGLDVDLLSRKDDLYGIINGVDYSQWDPESDVFIPNNYSLENMSGKLLNKKHLLKNLSLPFDENVPLIGMVSRLVVQKGFDIFSEAAEELMNIKAQWAVLGNGEEKYENLFRSISEKYPDKFSVYIGFNDELSHLIEAGADMLLMPSHYEPCGLNQIYSLRYGTVPIVRKTGGLADTVQDWDEYKHAGKETGNGFSFDDYSSYALFKTVERAVGTFQNKGFWKKIQLNGMVKDYSWESSAIKYLLLYQLAINKRKQFNGRA